MKSVKSVIQHLTLRACVLIDFNDWFIPDYKQDRKSPTSPTSPTNTMPMWQVMSGILGVNQTTGMYVMNHRGYLQVNALGKVSTGLIGKNAPKVHMVHMCKQITSLLVRRCGQQEGLYQRLLKMSQPVGGEPRSMQLKKLIPLGHPYLKYRRNQTFCIADSRQGKGGYIPKSLIGLYATSRVIFTWSVLIIAFD